MLLSYFLLSTKKTSIALDRSFYPKLTKINILCFDLKLDGVYTWLSSLFITSGSFLLPFEICMIPLTRRISFFTSSYV